MNTLKTIEQCKEVFETSQKPFKIRLEDLKYYCCKHDKYNGVDILLKEYFGYHACRYMSIDIPPLVLVEMTQGHLPIDTKLSTNRFQMVRKCRRSI